MLLLLNKTTRYNRAVAGYGVSYGAPFTGSNYQTYTWGFTWSQIINYFFK